MPIPPMEPFPRPDHDPGPPDDVDTATRWGLVALVLTVAGMGVALSAMTGRLDSALLFVGVPCVLALGVALLPVGGGWGAVWQLTTMLLLLASALLHEGALCVLIASPLVYGTVGLVYGAVRAARSGRSQRMAALPVLALLALEGAMPGLRVNAEQESAASRVVAGTCAEFVDALERGPRIDPGADRGLLLRLAQYPTPVAAEGSGLSVGDTWSLAMPAGAIDTEVAGRTGGAPDGRIDFTVTDDTARTTRWVDLHTGSLTWRQTDDGCRAEVTLAYTRKLDPSFWFGPVTDLFMGAGASALLAALD